MTYDENDDTDDDDDSDDDPQRGSYSVTVFALSLSHSTELQNNNAFWRTRFLLVHF